MTEITPSGLEMLKRIIELERRGDLPLSGLPIPSEDGASAGAASKLERDGMVTIHGRHRYKSMKITAAGRAAIAEGNVP